MNLLNNKFYLLILFIQDINHYPMEYHMFDSARDEKIKSLLSIVYPNRKCPTQSRFESFFKREISKNTLISSPIWEGTVGVRAFPIRSKKTKFKFKLTNVSSHMLI